MNRLTKFILAAASAFALYSAPAFASAGIYGTAVLLTTATNGGSASNTLYEGLVASGNLSDYAPSYTVHPGWTPATLTVNGTDSSGDFAGGTVNLGTFNVTTSDTLTLDGGEVLTYKNSNDNFTQADLYYSISGVTTTSTSSLAFNQDALASSNGSNNQRWYTDTLGVNLLNNLPNGNYTFDVAFDAVDNYGGSSPYVPVDPTPSGVYHASFTVVPEPSAFMMLVSSSVFGSFYLLRRRRK